MSGSQTDMDVRSEMERALLAKLATRTHRIPVLRRENGRVDAPASPTQRHFHAMQELYPGQSGFTMSGGLRLSGPLDLARLERAVAELPVRHEALRTVFEVRDGELRQVVLDVVRPPLPVQDIAEQDAVRVAKEFVDTPPDLEQDGPLRMAVLRLAEQDNIVLFALHHIVGDLRSVEIFFEELYVLYATGLTQQEAEVAGVLAPLTAQLVDISEWQRTAVADARREELRVHWGPRMAGAQRVRLPADATRVVPPSSTGHSLRLPMTDELVAGMQQLQSDRGCTVFTLGVAVFCLLLSRHSRQRDILVSTPVTTRDRKEVDKLIGANLNYIALRTHIDESLGFETYLDDVHGRITADLAHADLSYQDIAGLSGLATSELFRVLFQSGGDAEITFPEGDLDGAVWLAPWDHSMNDLTVRITSAPTGWYLYLNFRLDVFSPAWMTELGEEYLDLLADVVAAPGVPVAHVLSSKRSS
jgi:hypothetical protein